MPNKLTVLSFALAFLASGPAWAEGYSGQAWVESCFSDGEVPNCLLLVPGGRFIAMEDGSTPTALMDQMRTLTPGAAVRITAEITDQGDGVTKVIGLTAMERVEGNRFEAIYQPLQGEWRAEGEAGDGFYLRGGDMQQFAPDGEMSVHMISFDVTCQDGRAVPANPEGTGTMALIPYTMDPAFPATCHEVAVEADLATLTDPATKTARRFARVPGQPFDSSAYFLGCDAGGMPIQCHLRAGSFSLSVAQHDTDPALWTQLAALPYLASVDVKGTWTDITDASAVLTPTQITLRADDAFPATLTALQGQWAPADAKPFALLEIDGLDWRQGDGAELSLDAAILPDVACADGTPVEGGTALVLYPYGYDPSVSFCWRLVSVDATTLVIEDRSESHGTVTLTRQEPVE